MLVETDEVEAMMLFNDRGPIVAFARHGSSVTSGQEAVEAFAEVPVDRFRLLEVDPRLVGVLDAYFQPTVVSSLPAGAVAAEAFIRSFAKEGRRTCVVVQAARELALAFLDGEDCLAYRPGSGEAGGLDLLTALLAEPGTKLTVRTGAAATDERAGAGAPATESPPAAGEETQPRPEDPGPDAFVGASQDGPSAPAEAETPAAEATPALPAWPPASAPPPAPPLAERPAPDLLEAVMVEVQPLLGRNSARVREALRDVEPTPQAIAAAVQRLRENGIRLVSAEKMDLVVARTLAVLKEHEKP